MDAFRDPRPKPVKVHFFPSGKRMAALALKKVDGRQQLLLMSWDPETGKAFEPVMLFQGKSRVSATVPAGDRFVFIRQESGRPDEDQKDGTAYFDLATGKQVGTLPDFVEVNWVVGDRAFCRSYFREDNALGERLKAFNLKSEREAWSRVLRTPAKEDKGTK